MTLKLKGNGGTLRRAFVFDKFPDAQSHIAAGEIWKRFSISAEAQQMEAKYCELVHQAEEQKKESRGLEAEITLLRILLGCSLFAIAGMIWWILWGITR